MPLRSASSIPVCRDRMKIINCALKNDFSRKDRFHKRYRKIETENSSGKTNGAVLGIVIIIVVAAVLLLSCCIRIFLGKKKSKY